jgi:hypothetical protein
MPGKQILIAADTRRVEYQEQKEETMQRPKTQRWRRPRLVAQTLLVGACLTLATGTAAAAQPFSGHMDEQFAMSACPSGTPATIACVTVTGRGELSHLGKTAETVAATINLAGISPATHCAPDQAKATFTAANGDRLFVTTNGSSCPTGPGTGVDAGRYEITGGTGRFAGASGSGTYTTDAAYAADMQSGTSITTYTGTLDTRHGRGGSK